MMNEELIELTRVCDELTFAQKMELWPQFTGSELLVALNKQHELRPDTVYIIYMPKEKHSFVSKYQRDLYNKVAVVTKNIQFVDNPAYCNFARELSGFMDTIHSFEGFYETDIIINLCHFVMANVRLPKKMTEVITNILTDVCERKMSETEVMNFEIEELIPLKLTEFSYMCPTFHHDFNDHSSYYRNIYSFCINDLTNQENCDHIVEVLRLFHVPEELIVKAFQKYAESFEQSHPNYTQKKMFVKLNDLRLRLYSSKDVNKMLEVVDEDYVLKTMKKIRLNGKVPKIKDVSSISFSFDDETEIISAINGIVYDEIGVVMLSPEKTRYLVTIDNAQYLMFKIENYDGYIFGLELNETTSGKLLIYKKDTDVVPVFVDSVLF